MFSIISNHAHCNHHPLTLFRFATKKGTLQNSNVFSTKARSLRQSAPWLAGRFPIEFHDFPSDFLWIQWSRKCLSFPSLAAKTTRPSSSSWPWTLWDQASRPARLHNFGEVVWGWSARILIMQPMTKTTWQFHTQWRTIKQPINDCLPKQRYCFPAPNWMSKFKVQTNFVSHYDFPSRFWSPFNPYPTITGLHGPITDQNPTFCDISRSISPLFVIVRFNVQ